MKTNRVATLNAGKFKTVLQIVKNFGLVLLMSLLLVIISCDKGDDFEPIRNESPIDYESTNDDEWSSDNETPPRETPPDNEPPIDKESIIIYTDIEPDFTSENLNDSYDLDLNNDQNVDFTVRSDFVSDMYYIEYLVINSVPFNRNEILIVQCTSLQPCYKDVVPIDGGKEIRNGEYFASGGFLRVGDCHTGKPGCSYDWKDKLDKYLGLRFIINGQKHYGWARMDVTSATQWVIKDYAYNATPNKPILAGQRE